MTAKQILGLCSGSRSQTKGIVLGHADCIEELAGNEWKSSSGKGTQEKWFGKWCIEHKKETRVLCSDKIKTTDVTCLPLDVSDHTGTTYMHQSDYLAQNTGNDSVFKYCSRQSSFLLTGLTPWLSEHSSCKHGLCFSRCCASHAETLLNVHFWVYRSIYNFFTQKKAPIHN